MWQRLSERARKVIFYAQEEAQKLGEGYVSTEHLLLGLVREPDSAAARVLERMGVSFSQVRAEVEKLIPRGEPKLAQEMTLTPRAKCVIDLAYEEARFLKNKYIGTEHLLLGLIREGDGLAWRVLAKLGVDLERARREVMFLHGHKEIEEPFKHLRSPLLCAREKSMLFVVDVQEKLLSQIIKGEEVLRRIRFLVECARVLNIPILVTEQNPEKLGPTSEELSEVLSEIPRFAKMSFSCKGCPEAIQAFVKSGRRQAVLVGIETHICVLQSAVDLKEGGYEVFVCADGVGSRIESAHEIALARMRELDIQVTHTESVVYEWLSEAGTSEFRQVLEILKRY
jgi:nicotinamidase-related amidase